MLSRLRTPAARQLSRVTKRTYLAPVREMKFLLHDVHEFSKHYEELNSETPCDRETIGV